MSNMSSGSCSVARGVFAGFFLGIALFGGCGSSSADAPMHGEQSDAVSRTDVSDGAGREISIDADANRDGGGSAGDADDDGASSPAPDTASDVQPVCNELPNTAPEVTPTRGSGTTVFTGGRLLDGKYELTAVDQLETVGSIRYRRTLYVTNGGTRMDWVVMDTGLPSSKDLRISRAVSTSAAVLALGDGCGGISRAYDYSANERELQLGLTPGAKLFTYSRRP
jgi:hypothetical protein